MANGLNPAFSFLTFHSELGKLGVTIEPSLECPALGPHFFAFLTTKRLSDL